MKQEQQHICLSRATAQVREAPRLPFFGHSSALPQRLSALLPASCPGLGSVCMSDLSSFCWVALNQNPAPPCVPKRCPNTHFGTPKRALLLLSCPCPTSKIWAEPRRARKDKHINLASVKRIVKILLKTHIRKNVPLKSASLHITTSSTFCFLLRKELTKQVGFTRNAY